jgi:hypothetical protein
MNLLPSGRRPSGAPGNFEYVEGLSAGLELFLSPVGLILFDRQEELLGSLSDVGTTGRQTEFAVGTRDIPLQADPQILDPIIARQISPV